MLPAAAAVAPVKRATVWKRIVCDGPGSGVTSVIGERECTQYLKLNQLLVFNERLDLKERLDKRKEGQRRAWRVVVKPDGFHGREGAGPLGSGDTPIKVSASSSVGHMLAMTPFIPKVGDDWEKRRDKWAGPVRTASGTGTGTGTRPQGFPSQRAHSGKGVALIQPSGGAAKLMTVEDRSWSQGSPDYR